MKEQTRKLTEKVGWSIIAVIVVAFVAYQAVVSSKTLINPDEIAVKTVWGNIVPKTYGPGLVWNIPWSKSWGNTVYPINAKPRRYEYPLELKTKDLQDVTFTLAGNMEIVRENYHIMFPKYGGYDEYEVKRARDIITNTAWKFVSLVDIWALQSAESHAAIDAFLIIINDNLASDNYVQFNTLSFLRFKGSAAFEKMVAETVLAMQGKNLERYKKEMAEQATLRVAQEAEQNYLKMKAVAEAHGLEFKLTSGAVNNPYIAQYEMAKALSKWNGEMNLPSTLMIGGNSAIPFMQLVPGANNSK